MSVKRFCWLLNETKYSKSDKKWFPRWLRRYASTVEADNGTLPVSEESVIRFSKSLLENGTPAWQRALRRTARWQRALRSE